MTTAPQTDSWAGRVRTLLYGAPVDLLAVSAAALLVFAALAGSGGGYSWPRALAGFVFVLVLPGYALVSAVFPGRPTGSLSRQMGTDSAYSPGTGERLVLSFLFSLALVPMLALGHGLLGVPFETNTVLGSVTLLVVVLSVVAAVRRFLRPTADRYSPSPVLGLGARTRDWVTAGSTIDTVISLVLVLAVVVAISSVAFGLTGPIEEESYTGVSLVTESEDGGYVASNYPTNLSVGEGANLTLQVRNEYQTAGNYTGVVELQHVRGQGTDSIDVIERESIATLQAQVPANETWTATHAVEPTMAGTDLRLTYYVYRGDVPETATAETAEETIHLWVTVS